MTRGLAEKDGNSLVAARGARPFQSIPELARRSGLGTGALVRLAKADAFASLGLSRRQASWAIKGLRDEALPLFEAAEQRAQEIVPEQIEKEVSLPAMTRGREVVEDYRSHGLSLRPHPLAFLRSDLAGREISPCGALRSAKDGSRITVSGLVMVRQRLGSAKGVMFITLEDETDIANLIIWPSLFDRQRRMILGAQMLACRGKVQAANGVIHVVAEHLMDQSGLLRRVGGSDEAFVIPAGREGLSFHEADEIRISHGDTRALRRQGPSSMALK
jgi:error-prone DNA polymerase